MLKTFCLLALLPLAACSSPLTGAEVEVALRQTLEAARGHHEAGRDVEAARLLMAVTQIDPDYDGLADLDDQVPTLSAIQHPGALGSNVSHRKQIDPSIVARMLWYIPDRVLDIFDMISFDVHVGFGLYVDAHVTRAMQFALGGRSVAGIGWHDFRSLGGQVQLEATSSVLMFGAHTRSAFLAGTSGARGGTWAEGGLNEPTDPIYTEATDYWAVGAHVTAAVAGVDVNVHMAEIYDGIVGFLLFDPLDDDFATTESLKLSSTEKRFLRTVEKAASSEETIHRYRLFKGYVMPDAASVPRAPDAPTGG